MTHRNLSKLASSLAMLGLVAGYSVSASAQTCPETNDPSADYQCVIIDTGTDFSGNGSNQTGAFYELGYSGTLATSVYEAGLATGSQVVDSNITTVLNYYGLTGGLTNYTSVGGTTVALKDTPNFPGETNIDSLNDAAPNTNNFDAADTFGGIGWGLTYEYVIVGTLEATGPSYTSGYFDFFYEDWGAGTREQVLRVDVTGSNLQVANLDVFGTVTFDWTGGGNDIYGLPSIGDGVNDCTSTLCQNFWNFQTIGSSFFDLEGAGVEIQMAIDTNVNPPVPELNELVAFTGTDGETYWIRQSTLDGSARLRTVPEPGSLALLGLGLAGLGMALRRRRFV